MRLQIIRAMLTTSLIALFKRFLLCLRFLRKSLLRQKSTVVSAWDLYDLKHEESGVFNLISNFIKPAITRLQTYLDARNLDCITIEDFISNDGHRRIK